MIIFTSPFSQKELVDGIDNNVKAIDKTEEISLVFFLSKTISSSELTFWNDMIGLLSNQLKKKTVTVVIYISSAIRLYLIFL